MRIKLLHLLLIFQYCFVFAQSPVIVSIPSSENFGSAFSAGTFPLGNNHFITQVGDPGSFQPSQAQASTFNDNLFDVSVASVVSFDGTNVIPSSQGEGPYCYIDNDNAALLISLSDKINAVYFSANATGLTNIRLSFKTIFTEKSITSANAGFFVQYFNGTSWEDINGSVFTTNGKSLGDVNNFNCLALPANANGQAELKFRILTFQDAAVNSLANEVLSFAIDDIKITSQPLIPVVTNGVVSICGSGIAQFGIATVTGISFNIYDSNTIYITSVGANYSTSTLVNSTDYTIKAFDILAGCESDATNINAIVNSIPGYPILIQSLQTICGSGISIFSVASVVGEVYNWYTLSSSGTFLASGSDFSQSISASQIFWVDATSHGCTGMRTSATATVYTVPSAPTLNKYLQTICGSGIFTYSVTGTLLNSYYWYNTSVGGAAFLSANNYTTGTLSSQSEKVFVEAYSGFCYSVSRTEAKSISHHIPSPPELLSSVVSICGTNSVTFNIVNATEPNYYWYSTSIGGSLLSSANFFQTVAKYNTKDSVWVEANSGFCTGARTKGNALFYPTPDLPILDFTTKSICGSNTLIFSVLNNTSPGYNWYNTASGGTILGSNSTYTTPTSYNTEVDTWVSAFDGRCPSERVQSKGIFKYVPAVPILDQSVKAICGNGAISFNVTNNSEPQYLWYDAESNGNLTFTGAIFTTPSLYNTALNTWVEAYDGTCRSNRVKAEALFQYVPATPIIDQNVRTICGSGTLSFAVTNTAEPQYRWFNAANGGGLLATNTNYTIPLAYNTVVGIWVEAYDGKCSSIRVAAEAIFYYIPEIPILDNAVKSICGNNAITFNVTNNTEPQYRWYEDETTPTTIANTSSYTTQAFYNTIKNYWVDAFSGKCASSRVKVNANYDSIPALPIIINPLDSLCGDGTITFYANPKEGINLIWYTSETEPEAITATNSYTTPFLTEPNTYWVAANDGKCTSERVSVFAKIKDLPSPIINIEGNELVATENAVAFQWSIATPENVILGATENKLTIKYTGAYFVKLTAEGGCQITGAYSYFKAGGDTVYYEGFQNGMPANFTITNYDNASVQAVGGYATIYGTNAWVTIPATNSQTSTFFGGINNKVASATSLFNDAKIDANRWMISDSILLNHDGLSSDNLLKNTEFTLNWRAVSDDGGEYPDDYRVLISNTTKDTSSFTQLAYIKRESILPLNRSSAIPTVYNGQRIFVAFQLNTKRNKGNRLMVDDIMVVAKTDSIIIPPLSIEDGFIFNSAIYPNPASDVAKLRLNMATSAEVEIELFDIFGNQLIKENLGRVSDGEFDTELNIASFSEGVYILKILAGKQIKIMKLIVAK